LVYLYLVHVISSKRTFQHEAYSVFCQIQEDPISYT
jgi:hypothetical protein